MCEAEKGNSQKIKEVSCGNPDNELECALCTSPLIDKSATFSGIPKKSVF